MKKIKFLFVLCLSLALFNCGTDDGGGNDDASLIGSWSLTKDITKESGEPDDVYTVPTGCDEEVWKISSNKIEVIEDENCDGTVDYTDSVNYTKSGSTITTSDGFSFKITTLSQITLILEEVDGDFTHILEFKRL